MEIIQNELIAFRCPNVLKDKLRAYAKANKLRMSAVIRSACSEYLRKDQVTEAKK
jgi:hypothetical protein